MKTIRCSIRNPQSKIKNSFSFCRLMTWCALMAVLFSPCALRAAGDMPKPEPTQWSTAPLLPPDTLVMIRRRQ
ncbi:MAG: hypothetical protein V1899_10525 [Planctomycetota bacterium]